jgi:hypothetical protein
LTWSRPAWTLTCDASIGFHAFYWNVPGSCFCHLIYGRPGPEALLCMSFPEGLRAMPLNSLLWLRLPLAIPIPASQLEVRRRCPS